MMKKQENHSFINKKIFLSVIVSVAALLVLFAIFFNRNGNTACDYTDCFELKRTLVHNKDCFTEGLFVEDGFLFESVGLKGKSKIIKYDMNMNKIAEENIDENDFGEGATYFNGKIYMLTEKSKTVYVFDGETLETVDKIRYDRTGWGLTNDGEYLIAGDGSENLYFMDENLNTVRTVKVKSGNEYLKNINELEYINGKIWANVWFENYIAVINPENGRVEQKIKFDSLVPPANELRSRDSVLNGIAYDKSEDEIYITGKNWDKVYSFAFTED